MVRVLRVGCLALGVNFTLLRVGGNSNGDLIVVPFLIQETSCRRASSNRQHGLDVVQSTHYAEPKTHASKEFYWLRI